MACLHGGRVRLSSLPRRIPSGIVRRTRLSNRMTSTFFSESSSPWIQQATEMWNPLSLQEVEKILFEEQSFEHLTLEAPPSVAAQHWLGGSPNPRHAARNKLRSTSNSVKHVNLSTPPACAASSHEQPKLLAVHFSRARCVSKFNFNSAWAFHWLHPFSSVHLDTHRAWCGGTCRVTQQGSVSTCTWQPARGDLRVATCACQPAHMLKPESTRSQRSGAHKRGKKPVRFACGRTKRSAQFHGSM